MLTERWQTLSTREQRLLQLVALLVLAWALISLARPGWQQWQLQQQQQATLQQQLTLLNQHLPYLSRQPAPAFMQGATGLQAQLQRTLSSSGLPTSALQQRGNLWQVQLRNIEEAALWRWLDLLAHCQGQLMGLDLQLRSPGRVSLTLQMAPWPED